MFVLLFLEFVYSTAQILAVSSTLLCPAPCSALLCSTCFLELWHLYDTKLFLTSKQIFQFLVYLAFNVRNQVPNKVPNVVIILGFWLQIPQNLIKIMNKSTNFSLILFYLVSEIKFIQVLLFLKVPNIKELCKSSHHCWPWAGWFEKFWATFFVS